MQGVERREAKPEERAVAIARRLWPGEVVAVELLSGGITNANYKVTLAGGARFVVRVFGERTELLLVDRDAEEAATRITASLGLGPALVADLRGEGALVLELIDGAPISREQMADEVVLRRIAVALRTLHEGPAFPAVMDPFAAAETYYRTAQSYGVAPDQSADYEWAHEVAGRIRHAVRFAVTAPCHCDLLPANFLDDGEIRIIDWEYAGMSDPRFDLANFSANQGFEVEADRRLVRHYWGGDDEEAVAALRLLRFVSAFREAMWSYVQQHISTVDFDYRTYAKEYFVKMRATTEEPGFARWFELLTRAGVSRR
jgi:thiamine kinase-like enzyme